MKAISLISFLEQNTKTTTFQPATTLRPTSTTRQTTTTIRPTTTLRPTTAIRPSITKETKIITVLDIKTTKPAKAMLPIILNSLAATTSRTGINKVSNFEVTAGFSFLGLMIRIALFLSIFVLFVLSMICLIYLKRLFFSNESQFVAEKLAARAFNPASVSQVELGIERIEQQNQVQPPNDDEISQSFHENLDEPGFVSVPDELSDRADPGNFVLNSFNITQSASMTTHFFSKY